MMNAMIAAAVVIAGAMPALAQDAPSARQGLSDGTLIPSPLEEASSRPIEMPNAGMGPLRFRSQSPFQALRLGVLPNAPSALPRGQWEHRETFDWSRMWAESDLYLMSFDAWSSTHSIAHGVTDRLQLELGIVESGWSSGKLDGFVRSFHDLFGIAQGGRDTLPDGAFAFRLGNKNNPDVTLQEDDGEETNEQLVVSVHHLLTAGTDVLPALSVSVTLMTELGSSHVLGDAIDASVSFSLSKTAGDLTAYLTVGLAWYGHEQFLGVDLKPFALSIVTALEWSVSEGWSLVLQHHWVQGAVKNYGSMSKPSHEVVLGTRIRVSADSVFEVGVVENIVVFDNSPDFGLHSGIAVQF
jgi:hypothetical protein